MKHLFLTSYPFVQFTIVGDFALLYTNYMYRYIPCKLTLQCFGQASSGVKHPFIASSTACHCCGHAV